MGRFRVEQVTRYHDVEGGPLERHAVPAERDFDVLEVVPHLGNLGVAEHRTEHLPDLIERDLLGRADVPMADRHIAPFPHLGGERQPDENGAHRLRRRRLDSDGQKRRLARAPCELPERLHRIDGAASRRLFRGRRPGNGVHRDARDHAVEPELGIDVAQALEIRASIAQVAEAPGDRLVVAKRDELLREPRVGFVLNQHFAQTFFLDVGQVSIDPVERLEGVQKLRCRLRSDRRNAGDVVRRVADKRQEIAHLGRRNAELLQYLGRAVRLVAHRVPHDDALAEKLHQILVGPHDDDEEPLPDGVLHGGRDEVVRLDAVSLKNGNAVGLDDFAGSFHLEGEIGRPRRARRFVVGIELVTEGASLRVHRDREVRRASFADELLQHRHGPVGGVRRLPSCSRAARSRGTRETRSSRGPRVEDIGRTRRRHRSRHRRRCIGPRLRRQSPRARTR